MNFTALFDMDGVIIDSVTMNWQIYNALLEKYLVYVPDEYLNRYVGHALDDQLTLIEKDFSVQIDHADFIAQAEALRPSYYENLGARRGLHALLDEMRANNVKMGVVTVQPYDIANLTLAKLDIAEYFSIIVAQENVTNPKPDPEPYLTAAKALNVDPLTCVAFEDAPTGIQSAKLAGMRVVAVEQPYLLKEQSDQAHRTISSFDDINVVAITRLFS